MSKKIKKQKDGAASWAAEAAVQSVASPVRHPEQDMVRQPEEPLLAYCNRRLRRMFLGVRRLRLRLKMLIVEQQARNFPEANNFFVRLLLLICGLLPMWGSLAAERIWGRQKPVFKSTGSESHSVGATAFLGVALLLAAVVVLSSTYTKGATVMYNGDVIGAVDSEDTAESVISQVETVTTRTLGYQYTIDEDMVQYSTGWLKRDAVVEGEVLKEELSQEIGLVTLAYCLYVDGERIGATPYEGALEELLAQLQSAASTEDTVSCTFKEKVEVKQEYVDSQEIMNLGYIAEMLYSTKIQEVTYEVKKGDTWSEIAEDHGLTSKQLLALNPGYNIDKLQIGEILTLSAAVPYLTMTVVQQERYVDQVNYDVVYTNSADMYQGDYKVTSPGEYGAADVVANVTYVNGEVVERTILSSVTLKEPVTEQRLQGTKVRPTWHPTGSFRWPCSGRITSSFGGRSSPGGVGSTNHKGIDIANSYGTAVCASDGGRVTYAGWMSGYGYLVRIDHLNGYVTYYGHNSSLLVSVGETVYKGQQIAKMGSTGNSTGNHCHFEVRYNGVAKNPLNYL